MKSAGIGDGLGVITGGGGHYSPLPLLRGEVGDEIDSATDLKGSRGHMVFMFDVDFGIEKLVKLRIVVKRCFRKITRNDLSCC
jgi:hypothetical protein